MSRTEKQITFGFVLVVGLLAQSAYATKVAVGPSTCQPSLVHFTHIQDAINAVPFGTTILVCPGTYPEQLLIKQGPLTLQGVTDGVGNAAVVTVPGGGLVINGTGPFLGPFASQVLVQSAVGVTISDLIVDGTGATCVSGASSVSGIEYLSVGTSSDGTAAGKIQNVVVRNEKLGCGFLQGRGIVTENSYITIANNEIHDIDYEGIVTFGGSRNSITNNSVQRCNVGIYAETYGYPPSPVVGNSISDTTNGMILLEYNSASKNTIVNASFVGIWLYDDFFSSITQNTVSHSQYGLESNYSEENVIQSNVLNNSSQDGIRDENSFGFNNITKNTVNEAPYGIFTDASASADTYVPNSLFNVVVTVDPGTVAGPGTPPNP